MTCLHSPFAAAEGDPTVPQEGWLHPDSKGEELVWVCVCMCVHYGVPWI